MTTWLASANPALVHTLDVAVPMWIDELNAMDGEQRDAAIEEWAPQAVDPIASHGDILLYGSKDRGETARVFNELAQGLAAAAFVPGGVTFAGRHWCTDHQLCEAGRAAVRAVTA